jgi:hypothetical protein
MGGYDEQVAAHLVTHAAAMGGWLSADYVTGSPEVDWFTGEPIVSVRAEEYVPAADALVEAGLWELVQTSDPACRWIYRLTKDGWATAHEMGAV